MAATATAPRRRTSARSAAPARRPVRPAPAPRRAQPARRPAAAQRTGLVPVAVGTVSTIADSGLVLGLTRSRLWIGVLGSLLVGIVALNVMALSFNAQSSKTAALSDELREANSALRADIADGLSNERLQEAAIRIGLVMPQAASALILTPGSDDALIAAQRLRRGEFEIGSTFVPPAAEIPVEVPLDPAAAGLPLDPATTELPTDPATTAETTETPPAVATTDPTAPAATETGGGVAP